jgi:hypothetical protein
LAKTCRPAKEGADVNDHHDPGQLAAYAMGLLDGHEAQTTQGHIAGCPHCQQELAELREVDRALGAVSPELFSDGPPPEGDLLLQQILRQSRKQSQAPGKRRRVTLAAAAAAVLVGVGAGGIALGRLTAPAPIIAAPTPPPVAGSRVFTGANHATGARMTVTLTPSAGWVRVKATVVGIPAGQRCTLVVVDRNKDRYTAASWLASAAGETNGTTIDGAAIVTPADVTAVAVQNDEHRELVTVPA